MRDTQRQEKGCKGADETDLRRGIQNAGDQQSIGCSNRALVLGLYIIRNGFGPSQYASGYAPSSGKGYSSLTGLTEQVIRCAGQDVEG